MKSSTRNALSSAAAFFALCASVVACGPGGGGGGYRPYPSYPSQYSTVNSTPVNRTPVSSASPNGTANVASTVATPAAPHARLTVLPSDAPSANVQLASPVSTDSVKATVREVSSEVASPKVVPAVAKVEPAPVKAPTEVAKTDTSVAKALDATTEKKEEPSQIAEAIKGLVGTWMAVSRQGEGELSTVELQLDDSGWAKLTVPADGKPSTTTRKVEFENSELKLTGSGTDVTLGKLVDFDARQMVLERSGGQVTFVRP